MRFGVGTHYLYVSATRPVTRGTFLLVSLAPLAVISAVTMALALVFPNHAELPAAIFALNALGSAGDVVLAVKALGSPPGSLVVDRGDRSVVIPPGGQGGPPGWWASIDAFFRIYPIALTLVGAALALLAGGATLEFQGGSGFRLAVRLDPAAPAVAALISAAAATLIAARFGRGG